MLGRLEFIPGGRGKGEVTDLYGLPLLRVRADPEGLFGERRLRRAGAALRRGGAVRTLLPANFDRWDLLERLGLRGVEPAPFLRAQAPVLALEVLKRRDLDPGRATVALAGARTDAELCRAAAALCPKVRSLVIDAPGGQRLAGQLREAFGIPVLPAAQPAQLALYFHPGVQERAEPLVELYGRAPRLDGLRLAAPELAEEDREDLAVLCALWERGRLDVHRLKFT